MTTDTMPMLTRVAGQVTVPELAAPSKQTREEWLQAFVRQVRPWFGDELPSKVHVSVSFPSSGSRSSTIGECWADVASADRKHQIMIHPRMDDPIQVGATLVHELVHACRFGAGHGAKFKELAVKLGLAGKMTATHASDELAEKLGDVVLAIGPYPHPRLGGFVTVPGSPGGPGIPLGPNGKPRKPQTTRMLKLQCPVCDYTVRTTAKWVAVGLPSCPEGDTMALVDN